MSLPKDPKQAEEYKKRLSDSLTGRKLSEENIELLNALIFYLNSHK